MNEIIQYAVLYLASFTEHNVFEVYVVACISILFLLLNNIPLYGYLLFIHSLVNGHLGCLYFLAIVNNIAINIPVQVFVWIYVLISLGIGIKMLNCFPKQLYHSTFSWAICEVSTFSTSLPILIFPGSFPFCLP